MRGEGGGVRGEGGDKNILNALYYRLYRRREYVQMTAKPVLPLCTLYDVT